MNIVIYASFGFQAVLPEGYAYKLCAYQEEGSGFTTTLRLPLKTKEEAIRWQTDFQEKSKTTMRVARTYLHAFLKNVYRVSSRIPSSSPKLLDS